MQSTMGKQLKIVFLLFVLLAVAGILVPPEEAQRGGANRHIETGAIVPRLPDLRKEALQQVTLEGFSWSKGGFGWVMLLEKLVIKNSGTYPAKDFLITCMLSAPNGKAVDVVAKRLYETVPAGLERSFDQLNMGFVHEQAARASCQIADASFDLLASSRQAKVAKP
jgi:hypothetical protein